MKTINLEFRDKVFDKLQRLAADTECETDIEVIRLALATLDLLNTYKKQGYIVTVSNGVDTKMLELIKPFASKCQCPNCGERKWWNEWGEFNARCVKCNTGYNI